MLNIVISSMILFTLWRKNMNKFLYDFVRTNSSCLQNRSGVFKECPTTKSRPIAKHLSCIIKVKQMGSPPLSHNNLKKRKYKKLMCSYLYLLLKKQPCKFHNVNWLAFQNFHFLMWYFILKRWLLSNCMKYIYRFCDKLDKDI